VIATPGHDATERRNEGANVEISVYQVDAFTDRVFAGNPAAVCPLDAWLPDDVMQAVAAENNLSETAFFVPEGDGYGLRWFTPGVEVNLCGHATLATAHVLFGDLGETRAVLRFSTRSGILTVRRGGDGWLEMDFPATRAEPCAPPPALVAALGAEPEGVWRTPEQYLVLYGNEAQVLALEPDMAALARLDLRGIIVTAPGAASDIASRYFAPAKGVPEDPVTGSAHCALTPFWAARLGRDTLLARQVSRRGGVLRCRLAGDRVGLAGQAVSFMRGTIRI